MDDKLCDSRRKFDLSPHTEVALQCGLASGHDGLHYAADIVGDVHIVFRWPA